MTTSPIDGTWSYRALHNDPDLDVAFGDLRFATAAMTLREEAGRVSGRVVGEGWGTWTEWSLDLAGQFFGGYPSQLRLRGTNTIDGEPWIYDYRAFLMPHWPHGDGIREVLVGSVIRSNARASHQAVAGLYASLYAVKRD